MGVANFIPVRREGDAFFVGEGMQNIPWESPKGDSAKWVGAFRPSDIKIAREGTGLKGIVKRASFLGAMMDYLIEIDGAQIRTELETLQALNANLMFAEGDMCDVTFHSLHWFDDSTAKGVK